MAIKIFLAIVTMLTERSYSPEDGLAGDRRSRLRSSLERFYRRSYQGINYLLRSKLGGRFAAYSRPTSISLLLTNYCNAHCVHCEIWKNRRLDAELGFEDWKRLLTDLRSWLGPVHLFMTGGEALLRPFAPDVCAEAARMGFFVEFLTNGYWKDQSRVERLARARPSRVTISLDGVGETHSLVRGKRDFWETTRMSLETLQRLRRDEQIPFQIKLKTVIMDHNLDGVVEVARFAQANDMQVMYQPIEQNYNAPEDPAWFEHAGTWPRDTQKAIAVVDELESLQQAGLPILNSAAEFAAMRQYFCDPRSNGAAVQAHMIQGRRLQCATLGNLQIESNGDVKTCFRMPPIGNLCEQPIRTIWLERPRWWEGGCCMETPCSLAGSERLNV